MEKPRDTIYAIRLLYGLTLLVGGAVAAGLVENGSSTKIWVLCYLPLIAVVYFIYLIAKGIFWVRSVFLALTIAYIFKFLGIVLLAGSSRDGGILAAIMVMVIAGQITALWLLYTRPSNMWFAKILLAENQKKLAKRKKHPALL